MVGPADHPGWLVVLSPPLELVLAARAERDLRALDSVALQRVQAVLDNLAGEAANLDVKALAGHLGWLRLRVGDWRVLYRPLTEEEASQWGAGYLVARVVHRRDLELAARTL